MLYLVFQTALGPILCYLTLHDCLGSCFSCLLSWVNPTIYMTIYIYIYGQFTHYCVVHIYWLKFLKYSKNLGYFSYRKLSFASHCITLFSALTWYSNNRNQYIPSKNKSEEMGQIISIHHFCELCEFCELWLHQVIIGIMTWLLKLLTGCSSTVAWAHNTISGAQWSLNNQLLNEWNTKREWVKGRKR